MKHFKKWKIEDLMKEIPLGNFYSKIHPEIYLIPKDLWFNVVDDFGDRLGILISVAALWTGSFTAKS